MSRVGVVNLRRTGTQSSKVNREKFEQGSSAKILVLENFYLYGTFFGTYSFVDDFLSSISRSVTIIAKQMSLIKD